MLEEAEKAMDDIKLALLGDHEAARQLTDAGVLLFGDCLDLMPALPENSVDLLFTDLPYGTTNCRWDTPIDLERFWQQAKRIVRPGGCKALFAQTPFDKVLGVSNLQELRYEWIWEKTQATGHLNAKKMPMKAHENILIFYDHLPTYNPQITHGHKRKISTAAHKRNCRTGEVYHDYAKTGYDSTDRYPRDVLHGPSDKQKLCLHPAQKPVWLCKQIVLTYTNPGDTVLDCCMGSGSIGVACLETKRRYIGMEKDKKIFDTAKARLAWNTRAPVLTAEEMEMLEGMENG